MTTFTVSRQHTRHRLNVVVEFGSERSVTRDVSIGGIYFESQTPVEVGDHIRFALVFEQRNHEPLRVECDGVVIRTEALEDAIGVAATIDGFASIAAAFRSVPSHARNGRAPRGR